MAEPLERALAFATERHAGQTDKAGRPYIDHPKRVAARLAGEPVDVQVAGLLHDVVEDTDTTLAEIEVLFGPRVAELVDAVTWREGESVPDYFDRIRATGPDAIAVKLADNSDEQRLALLPPEKAAYLRGKYEYARNYLADTVVT